MLYNLLFIDSKNIGESIKGKLYELFIKNLLYIINYGFIMLKLWIEENKKEKPNYPNKMEFYEYQEKIEITDEIKIDISKRVLFGFASHKFLKGRFNNLTSEEIKECLIESILPEKNAKFYPQKSMWGEIIAVEILNVFKHHLIPFYRLRHKEKQNQAMRGEADVVTCYLGSNPLIIAFTEVKTKGNIKDKYISSYKKEMRNAEKELVKDNVDKPEILEYMYKILNYDDKYDLLEKFDDAIKNPDSYKKEFHIFMIMEKCRWEEKIIDFFKKETTELPNLTINIVLINSLNELIDETYEIILEIAEDVVNDFKD